MNRRNFIKTMALGLGSLFLRGDTMRLDELLLGALEGVSGGKPIQNREELRLALSDVENVRRVAGGWIGPDGRVKEQAVSYPVVSLYSRILEADVNEVVIPNLPVDFRNLILIVHGQVNDATFNSLQIQFNGDTGENYEWQYIRADGSTVDAEDSTLYPKTSIFLGQFGTSAASARPGMIVTNIPNYASNVWKKTLFSNNYFSENNTLLAFGGIWKSTSPIESLRVFNANASVELVAGSLVSLLATL